MDIIELVNAYRQERDPEKGENLARLLYETIKQDLRVYFCNEVHPSLMEDVLQETLITVFKKLDTFRGKTKGQFRSWYNTIFRRRRSDMYRQKFMTMREPLTPEELRQKTDQALRVEPVSSQDRLDVHDALIILEKLKPGCHSLIWKRRVIEMKLREIVKEFKLKSNTVRMRIKRCEDKLRGLL